MRACGPNLVRGTEEASLSRGYFAETSGGVGVQQRAGGRRGGKFRGCQGRKGCVSGEPLGWNRRTRGEPRSCSSCGPSKDFFF